MFRFPFVDWIEGLIKSAKGFGSPVYWAWVALSGLVLGIAAKVMSCSGLEVASPLLVVGLLIWLGGIYPVYQYEKHWKEVAKRKKTVEPKGDEPR